MIKKIMSLIKKINVIFFKVENIERRLDAMQERELNDLKSPKVAIGKLLSEIFKTKQINSLHEIEFQVFSQWGDDGIIQYLVNNIEIENKIFVEFGVENYRESNTRFLLINNNWQGLVMDGSKENIRYIQQDYVAWSNHLDAVNTFITKENINEVLTSAGYVGNIGILSIDIDGNDYWVWKQINVVSPVIVIIEYNSLFGPFNPWTLIYKADFVRENVNSPKVQYYGTSLTSACDLAKEKGYIFIGCNSNGNNAYFIKNDKAGKFKALTPEEGYVNGAFREYSRNGVRVGGQERLEVLKGLPIFNTRTDKVEEIK